MDDDRTLHKDGGRYYRALTFFYIVNCFLLPIFIVLMIVAHGTKIGKQKQKQIENFCEMLAHKRDFYKYWIYLNCNPVVWETLKY
jgi:hypothetical protein